MRSQVSYALFLLAGVSAVASQSVSFTSYANDWVDPDYILAKDFSSSTIPAQNTIRQWADFLAAQGPWSVMNKTVIPPTGNKHDYMSWAPYSWPDCSSVGNTTALTPEQIWTTCPYVTRDGQFNPDGRLVNDTGAFDAMSNAILYNSISWVLTGSQQYSVNTVNYVKTWFLDADTAMTPNLQYAQMARGPNGQIGAHTGVLDLKGMARIVSAIEILRKGNSSDWTSDIDTAMVNWTTSYIGWLETSPIALGEYTADNNHGTFYYNQLAALKILVNNNTGAADVIKDYYSKQYLKQINADGEQPLEAIRTRPYHYRAYNLAAMIVNARIGNYTGFSAWKVPTTSGADIQTACDFAMTIAPGTELAKELYPDVAAVAAEYGDPTGKYAAFLKTADNLYPAQGYFLWNQPLTDSGLVIVTSTSTAGSSGPSGTSVKSSSGSMVKAVGISAVGGLVAASSFILGRF